MTGVFEHLEVTAEVAVGQVQLVFQERELGLVCLCEHSHDAEPHPLVDHIIEESTGMSHPARYLEYTWTAEPARSPAKSMEIAA